MTCVVVTNDAMYLSSALCQLINPMHEFSISSEIVKSVLDAAEKHHGKKVLSINLDIGELTLLSIEQVTFWIKEMFRGSIAEGAKIKVKMIKTRIRCEACEFIGRATSEPEDSFQHLGPISCQKCGSFRVRIEKGRECNLRKIEAVQ